jgi:hypothetical protein
LLLRNIPRIRICLAGCCDLMKNRPDLLKVLSSGFSYVHAQVCPFVAERLRIDVAVRANAEARFNAPPHQSELN